MCSNIKLKVGIVNNAVHDSSIVYVYRRTLYLAICSENAVGGILIWRILRYGEKPIFIV